MNKNAIKKFAIDARNKLIDSVTDKAGMLGITKDACGEPITKGADFEVWLSQAGEFNDPFDCAFLYNHHSKEIYNRSTEYNLAVKEGM